MKSFNRDFVSSGERLRKIIFLLSIKSIQVTVLMIDNINTYIYTEFFLCIMNISTTNEKRHRKIDSVIVREGNCEKNS